LLVAYVLIDINILFLPNIPFILFLLTAGITIISGLQYIYRGLKLTHAN